ncbi:MAG: type I DNA topoisomerase, partial [Alphaproteobacteria bacterium]
FKAVVDDKIENVKKSDVTSEATGEKCPTCHEGDLMWRLSRFGKKFKGCNRYPDCTYIENTNPTGGAGNGEDTGIQCPKCKAANILKKLSRRGTTFYSCQSWPKCDYSVWDAPQANPCPSCHWPITVTKVSKKFGEWHRCPQEGCDWNDNAEAAAVTAAFRARFMARKDKAAEGKAKAAAAKKAKKGASKAAAKPATKATKKAPAKKAGAKKAASA